MLIEESWLSVSIRRAMYLLISTLMYQGLERSSVGWYTRLVVRILSIIPFSYASSNFLKPLVKRPNVVAQNTLLAPRFLSPVERIQQRVKEYNELHYGK